MRSAAGEVGRNRFAAEGENPGDVCGNVDSAAEVSTAPAAQAHVRA